MKANVNADFLPGIGISELSTKSDYWLVVKVELLNRCMLVEKTPLPTDIWEAALAKISDKLKSLQSPDNAAFYTSGRTSNEAYLYQAFVRCMGQITYLIVPICVMNHGKALNSTIGIGKGTVIPMTLITPTQY